MLIQKNIDDISKRLSAGIPIYITIDDTDIRLRSLDQNNKVEFKAVVYKGGNYIPPSVRKCVQGKSIFKTNTLPSYLNIDEEKFEVNLNYISMAHSNKQRFVDEIEEFSFQAGEWRLYLDEHDKNDLVYVHVK